MLSGCIIVFEGIDNSGKTTQCHKLAEKLKEKGYEVSMVYDYDLPIHGLIKEYFQAGEFSPYLKTMLFATEIFDLWFSHLRKDWISGKIIIFDRYTYSLFAYGIMERLDRKWIQDVVMPLPKADIVIYIDISPNEYLKRIKGRDRYISPYSLEQLSAVRNNYFLLAEEEDFIIIDGSKKETEIEKLIYDKISAYLNPDL